MVTVQTKQTFTQIFHFFHLELSKSYTKISRLPKMETSKMPNFEPQRKQNFENKINALEPLFTAEVKFSNSSYRFHEIVICTNPE